MDNDQLQCSPSSPIFLFIVGPPGSGKTTLMKNIVQVTQGIGRYAEKQRVAWVENHKCVVFGRYQGFHPDGSSKLAGRLDGCDRL